MSTYLTDMETDIRSLLRDKADVDGDKVLNQVDLRAIITEQVLLVFSKHFPYKRKKNYYGSTDGDYLFALPSDWITEFSVMLSVQDDLGNQIEDIRDNQDYEVDVPDVRNYTIDNVSSGTSITLSTAAEAQFFIDGFVVEVGDDDANQATRVATTGVAGTGMVVVEDTVANIYDSNPYVKRVKAIRFKNTSFTSTGLFVVEYTALHVLTQTSISIWDGHLAAFKHLGAAIGAAVIANKCRHFRDSSIDADAVDYLSLAEQWDSAAKMFFNLYKGFIGDSAEDTAIAPASTTQEWDLMLPWGREHVFHPRSWH